MTHLTKKTSSWLFTGRKYKTHFCKSRLREGDFVLKISLSTSGRNESPASMTCHGQLRVPTKTKQTNSYSSSFLDLTLIIFSILYVLYFRSRHNTLVPLYGRLFPVGTLRKCSVTFLSVFGESCFPSRFRLVVLSVCLMKVLLGRVLLPSVQHRSPACFAFIRDFRYLRVTVA